MSNRKGTTRAQRARNKRVVRDGGGICHLCGHPGADAADHVVPLSKGGTDTVDNLKPAHHRMTCETCGRRCNLEKGSRLLAPVMPYMGAEAF